MRLEWLVYLNLIEGDRGRYRATDATSGAGGLRVKQIQLEGIPLGLIVDRPAIVVRNRTLNPEPGPVRGAKPDIVGESSERLADIEVRAIGWTRCKVERGREPVGAAAKAASVLPPIREGFERRNRELRRQPDKFLHPGRSDERADHGRDRRGVLVARERSVLGTVGAAIRPGKIDPRRHRRTARHEAEQERHAGASTSHGARDGDRSHGCSSGDEAHRTMMNRLDARCSACTSLAK